MASKINPCRIHELENIKKLNDAPTNYVKLMKLPTLHCLYRDTKK